MDIVKRVIAQRRADKEHKQIPFIDSLLQNYDDEDKVNRSLGPSLSLPLPFCFLSPLFHNHSNTDAKKY